VLGDRGGKSMHAMEPRKKKPSVGLQELNANLYKQSLLNKIIMRVAIPFAGGILCGL
jgi:hypothetical protein